MFKKLANSELGRPSAEEYREMDKLPVVVVLDNVRSQHNIGSVFRTSDAFLAERVILCGICATPPTPEIHKSALGAEMSVVWEYAKEASDAVRELKEDGYTVIAVEQTRNSVSVENLSLDRDKKYALVFGNEVKGVSQEVIDLCDSTLEIPQWGTKHSLNVSVSAGVVLWEVCKSLRSIFFTFVFLLFGATSCCYTENELVDADFEREVDFYERMSLSITDIDTLGILAEFYQNNDNLVAERAFRLQLGTRYRDFSMLDKSIEQHLSALHISRHLRDTLGMVESLNQIGIDYYRLGSLEQASSFCFMAYDYCELYSDKESRRAISLTSSTLRSIGAIYLLIYDYKMAENSFRSSLELDHKLNEDAEGFAASYMNLGYIYEQKGSLDTARFYYQTSMSHNYKINSPVGIARCHKGFGSLSERVGNYEEALKEYNQSYDILKKGQDYYYRVDICLALANLHSKMGNLEDALNYANLSLERSEEILAEEQMYNSYIIRSDIYLKKGDYKSAFNDLKRANDIEQGNATDKKILELQQRRINEVKRRNMEALRIRDDVITQERDSKSRLLFSSSVIFILLAIVIFLLFKNHLASRKAIRAMADAEDMRTDFYARVTHEFRTPLSIILGQADMIARRDKDEKVKSMAKSILTHSNHLINIVNELLDIAKLDNSINKPHFERGDIVLLLKMMVDSFRTVANKKMVNLDFMSEVSSIQMDFIPYYMTKIALNLISNAIKFTPKGHNVYVAVAMKGNNVEITVADTGVGIDPKDLENIFEPFYQGQNSKADLGTGIGLSLVHQMTLAMNGTIEVFSIKGEGTSFVLTIPQITSLQDEVVAWGNDIKTSNILNTDVSIADEEVELKDDLIMTDHPDKPVVLIVEDHREISYYVSEILGDNYSYLFADSGLTAIEKAKEYLPDIIITDLMMPEMDGYELIDFIRKDDSLRLIPVVVVSALNDIDNKVKILSMGADAYISKPFDPRELLGIVSNLLQKISERQKSLMEYMKKLANEKNGNWQDDKELVSAQDKEFLVKLHQVIHSNISNSALNSEFISDKIFLSRSQVNRKVKSLTGMDTNAFIRYNRLTYAKELILQSDLPIGEIVIQSGFEHQSYFSKQFKQQFGVTPTEARNNKSGV